MVSNKDIEIRKILGSKLSKARKKTSLTQAEVARLASIHVNYYARVERGEENPTYEKLHGIAKALGLNPSDIFPS